MDFSTGPCASNSDGSGNPSHRESIPRTPITDIDGSWNDGRPRKPLPPPTLACHFLKRDSVKFRACKHLRLGRVRDVKQHLIQRHNLIYCARCSKSFTSKEDLSKHLTSAIPSLCVINEGLHSDWRAELHKESKQELSVEQQWFEVWDLVFPEIQRPQTVYLDEASNGDWQSGDFSRNESGDFLSSSHSGPPTLDHAGDVDISLLRGVVHENIDGCVDPPHAELSKPQDDFLAKALPNDLILSAWETHDFTLSESLPGQAIRHNLQSVSLSPDLSPNVIISDRGHSSTPSCGLVENGDYEHEHLLNHQIGPEYAPRKPNVPFTDSGYASTSRNDGFQYAQIPQNSSQRDKAESKDAIIEDDNRTIYSADGSLQVSVERQYISEACQSIRDSLGDHADPERWTFPSERLHEFLKAFAVKIGLESADQANLRVMWFFHKYGEKIARQLLCNDLETETKRDDGKSMPLEDKLSLWWDEARYSTSQIGEDRCTDDGDISPGGEDDGNTSGEDNDNQDIENTEASSHNKTVLESSAFCWLVRSLRNEMALQEDCDSIRGHDSRVDIRRKILHHLATGRISKSRPPIIHKVMVRLCNWPMITHNGPGRSNNDYSTRTFDSMVVVCCGGNSQLLSIKQYLKQTWPSTYYQIMSLLQYPSNDRGADAFVVGLPDRTQLVMSAEQSDLVLGISGPAHTIAECIEQLAWVLAALCFPRGYSGGISQHGPIISEPQKVPNDPTDRVLELMQPPPRDEHYACFDINVGASDQALISADQSNLISAFSGRHVMVHGYPILRRSAVCRGIEISPEYVPKLWGGLVSVQNRTDAYLWQENRKLDQICPCRPEDDQDQNDARSFGDLKKLWSSRHFIELCNDEGQVEVPSWELQSVFDTSPRDFSVEYNCFACKRSQKDGCRMEDGYSERAVEDNQHSTGYSAAPDQREQTFTSTSSGELTDSSFDPDWVPPSIDSATLQARFNDSPIREVLPIAVSRLLSDFQSAAGGQEFTSPCGHKNSRLTVSSNISATTFSSQRNLKRKRGSNDNPDSDDERSTKRPMHTSSSESPPSKCFACPFFKIAPDRYESCLSLTLRRIGDVKQHLSRAHKRPFSCRNCLALFPTEEGRQDHTPRNTFSCQQAPPNQEISPLEGYSESKALELSRKSNKGLGQAERWFVMWDILFPGYPHPRSPYLDPALSKQVKSLCDYVGANGPSIILQELERDGALQQLCTNGQSELLREAMGQAVQLMIEEACVHVFSGVPPGTSQQTHIPKPPSLIQDVSYAETFSALSADSGVALMTSSTASDRQSQSQRQPMLNAPRQYQGLATVAQAEAVIESSSIYEQMSMASTPIPGPATGVDLAISEHYADTPEGCIQESKGAPWEIGQDDSRFQVNPIDTGGELEDFHSILNGMLGETGGDYGGCEAPSTTR